MKFLFGVAFGALGMWAYSTGKFRSFMGGATDSMEQTWQAPAEIARPSAAEISGRPSEPLPTTGA